MDEHNRDLFPNDDIVRVYAPIAPLIHNAILDDAFKAHELAAVQAKRSYHVWGRRAVWLVVASALYTVAEALVIPAFTRHTVISVVAVVLGAAGITIQIYLIYNGTKRTWLMNRFAAERLRSIKFQAYPLAFKTANLAALRTAANEFYREHLARLRMELNGGVSVLSRFNQADAVTRLDMPATGLDPAASAKAQAAYRDLRIGYQRRFAAAEVDQLNTEGRVGHSTADMLFLVGAVFTVAALVIKLLLPDAKLFSAWVDFAAVAIFIVSLAKTMMEEASIGDTSRSRYEHYIQMLEAADTALAREGADFAEVVARIELVAMDELDQFCRAAIRINYRL